jgi:hypothetical protein
VDPTGTTLPPPPQLPRVDAPPPPSSRRVPVGAIVAALALVGALALIGLAVAGVSPFTSSASPSAPPTATPGVSPPVAPSPTASPTPSASPTPLSSADIEAQLAAIEKRMTQIRELPAVTSLPGKLVTTAEASKILVGDFHKDNPKQLIDDTTGLDRGLGLLSADQDLATLFDRFLSTQVLGFYRDTDKALYIVSDQGFGPLEKFTASHEYTHALQDANFDLKKISPDAFDQGDRQLARTALIEGDATLAMQQWALADLTADELTQLLEQLQDPGAQQALEGMPPIVLETQEFPYTEGLKFVQAAWTAGGWSAVDKIWMTPPDTVEQVLHPEKYAAHEKPVAVALPSSVLSSLGSGWGLALQDTAGELVTRIWLAEANDTATATQAAAGWGGDRMGYYKGPSGAWAVVWSTRWDAGADTTQFVAAARAVASKLPHAGVISNDFGNFVVVASDVDVYARVAEALA